MKWMLTLAAAMLLATQTTMAEPSRYITSDEEAACLLQAAQKLPSNGGVVIKNLEITSSRSRSSASARFYDVKLVIEMAGYLMVSKKFCSVDADGTVRVF